MVSIITIHRNEFQALQRTMDSVRDHAPQGGFEWIVVDGGSEPDRPEAERVMRTAREIADCFVSEPDEGIYDAMNKGTALARGEYVLYLNAGDVLNPDVDWSALRTGMQGKPGMIWGNSWDIDRKNNLYPRKSRAPAWLRYGMAVCHQAVLFRRDALGDAPYDRNFLLAADYELICRLFMSGAGVVRVGTPVVIFDLVGESGRDKRKTLAEESRIRSYYFRHPRWLERPLTWFKWRLWELSSQVPASRKLWRKWV